MKCYARLQDSRIAELLSTDRDIATLFNPALAWIDVSDVTGIAIGWVWDGSSFARPEPQTTSLPALSLADLQAQIAYLSAQLATLVGQT